MSANPAGVAMIGRIAVCLVGAAYAAALHAQAPDRLPVIAGGMDVNLLVEVDATVKSWGSNGGGPREWALTPVPFYKVKLAE